MDTDPPAVRWRDRLACARRAASEAARIQSEHHGTIEHVRHKGEVDLLTHVDLACERAVIAILREAYPDDEILAEESDLDRPAASPFRWVVDPLDGTTNYAHGYPLFAVSIAMLYEGEPVIGVVNAPMVREEFFAVRGGGAFVNDAPLSVSSVDAAERALFATGFGYDRRERVDALLAIFREFVTLGHGARRCGAASLDLCYVAAGRVDGFWEEKLNAWDIAAGVLIVREAGGTVTNFDGTPIDLYGETICASNGRVHDEMLAVLSRFGPWASR